MKKIIVFLVISCFILPNLAFAGAWTVGRGNIWLEQTAKYSWAKWDYDENRHMRRKGNNARSWGWSHTSKAEYGLLDWLTILGGVEYKLGRYTEYDRPVPWGDYDVSNNAFTSAECGVRIRHLKEPVVLSTQIKGYLYLDGKGYRDPIPASPSHPSADRPPLTDGSNALEIRSMVGKIFDEQIPFYYGFEAGYRFRNKHACNEVPLFAEMGVWPVRWLLIKSEIDVVLCHDGTGDFEKDYAIWRAGPIIYLLDIYHMLKGIDISSKEYKDNITKKGRSINVEFQYGWTFWGRNTSADRELIVKVSTEF